MCILFINESIVHRHVGLGRTWLDLVRRDCVIELVGLGWVNGWLVNDIQS